MADPVKQARDLARFLAKAKRQARGIQIGTGAPKSPRDLADALAREVTAGLLARGLLK